MTAARLRRKRGEGQGAFLLRGRELVGLSRTEVALALVVSRTTVHYWETDTHPVSLGRVDAVAKLYQLSAADLAHAAVTTKGALS